MECSGIANRCRALSGSFCNSATRVFRSALAFSDQFSEEEACDVILFFQFADISVWSDLCEVNTYVTVCPTPSCQLAREIEEQTLGDTKDYSTEPFPALLCGPSRRQPPNAYHFDSICCSLRAPAGAFAFPLRMSFAETFLP